MCPRESPRKALSPCEFDKFDPTGYEFGDTGMHGKFAGHGVSGEFSFEVGKVTVTITGKPFWLLEMLLKQKITAGLDSLCNKQA